MAVVVFVLLGGLGRGWPARHNPGVKRAAVCLTADEVRQVQARVHPPDPPPPLWPATYRSVRSGSGRPREPAQPCSSTADAGRSTRDTLGVTFKQIVAVAADPDPDPDPVQPGGLACAAYDMADRSRRQRPTGRSERGEHRPRLALGPPIDPATRRSLLPGRPGRGRRSTRSPFPMTVSSPARQSMSSRRRPATSPRRSPSRANSSKIA